MIEEIKIDELYVHPNNVRKVYKDIDELAESIKEKGILQNLTVVKGHFDGTNWAEDGYTVVIGNRRLLAARKAGIETAPCAVKDMEMKDQVSTMLLENMQRKDLTAFEESKGFQLCLDLGISEDELSKKTGLTKKTIRHRVKMQDLNQEEVEKKCAEGATIFDFIKLEQIKDLDKRNKVLESIGTADFNMKVEQAIREEKKEEARKKVIEMYDSFAEKIESREGKQCVKSWYNDTEHLPERPDDVLEKNYYYLVEQYGITLFTDMEIREEDSEERQKAEEARLERERITAKFNELGATFFDMRQKFILDRNRAKLTPERAIWWLCKMNFSDCGLRFEDEEMNTHYHSSWGGINEDIFVETFGKSEEITADEELRLIDKNPIAEAEKIIYSCLERGKQVLTKRWDFAYQRCVGLEMLYSFLRELGYRMSEEEEKILNGSHELYKEEEVEEE